MRAIVRHVDTVTVKGSNQPIGIPFVTQALYACDLNPHVLEVELFAMATDFDVKGRDKANISKTQAKKRRQYIYNMFLNSYQKTVSCFKLLESDKDFRRMREIYTSEFFKTWDKGMSKYIDGDWEEAIEYFYKTRVRGIVTQVLYTSDGVEIKDGPSNTLISVIESNDFKAPSNWRGCRELTQK